jgi:hypothetical protein
MLKKMLTGSVAMLLALPLTGVARAADVLPAEIRLGARTGHATPFQKGCAKLGGGNIDVIQPTPDVLIITLSGAAVACGTPVCASHGSYAFDVSQCFEIVLGEKVKAAKLIMEGQVIGLLRSPCKKGTASSSTACAGVAISGAEVVQDILSLSMPPHSVACGQNLSINDKEGPVCVPVVAGCYTLHQTFGLEASQDCGLLCRGPSAEFADGALDPLWLSSCEPFYGAAKKNYGFQIILRVEPTDEPLAGPKVSKISLD